MMHSFLAAGSVSSWLRAESLSKNFLLLEEAISMLCPRWHLLCRIGPHLVTGQCIQRPGPLLHLRQLWQARWPDWLPVRHLLQMLLSLTPPFVQSCFSHSLVSTVPTDTPPKISSTRFFTSQGIQAKGEKNNRLLLSI